MSEFSGFKPTFFRFLAELERNNEREWWDEHKARYEEDVREVALAFIRAMAPHISAYSKQFVCSDKKVGGSMMRPYRDIRFSKDKTPFKSHVGIQFRHKAGKDVHAPGIYVHLHPNELMVGAGIWRPAGEDIKRIRAAIDERRAPYKKAAHDPATHKVFGFHGESLKTSPRGYSADHPLIEDLRRKDHILTTSLSFKELADKRAPERIAKKLSKTRPYVRFLCKALDVAF